MLRRFHLTLALVVCGPIAVSAQETVPVTDLATPSSVFPEPFTRVAGIRELPDGRTLIADRTEQHVSFIDFEAGTLEQVGREGGGPGEYSTPMGLLPLPDDATLLVDLGNMRTTRIEADGRLEDAFPMMQGDGTFIMPGGTDSNGIVFYSSAGVITVRSGGGTSSAPADSSAIMRWDPLNDGPAERAGMLKIPEPALASGGGVQIRSGGGGGMNFTGMPVPQPFAARDDWAVALDGRIAVARAEEYRLDWYAPDGSMLRGPSVDYEPVRITKSEKEAWADEQASRVMSFRMQGGGGRTMNMQRPDIDEVDFPESMPPFGTNAVRITPSGEVWVQRSQPSSDERHLFDVFDERGHRVAQVRLAPGRQLIGFGSGSVYAVATDDDDLQWLERYVY